MIQAILVFAFCIWSILAGAVSCSKRFAHADMVDDEKTVIDRCEFAIKAARIPPGVPVSVICEKPFQMIDDGEFVTVSCKKFCKERGIK